MINGKKGDLLGGEMMLWIYRFALIGLVIFSFSIIILNFYSVKYDIRSSVEDKNQEVYVDFNLKDFNEAEIAKFDIGKDELRPLCNYDVYCSSQKYYFLTDDNQKAKLELFIAINKIDENV